MKKLMLALLVVLIFAGPVISEDRTCAPVWDNVSGQTYVLDIDGQSYDVVFSPSFTGPCPQGEVQIYDGIYIAPRLTCSYMTEADDLVSVTCGDGTVYFLLHDNKLLVVDPNTIFMVKKNED